MNLWLVLVLAGAGTLLLRLSFILVGNAVRLPAVVDRAADLVFPVTIAAILATSLRGVTTSFHTGQIVALVLAAAATALVSRLTGSIIGALATGLAVMAAASLAVTALP
ncbi:MAG TPA: AzlD domain-containing protein [Micromonosporaceae bacterium]|nr:AzlD domain-containing protein [Actinoplanes sp.]